MSLAAAVDGVVRGGEVHLDLAPRAGRSLALLRVGAATVRVLAVVRPYRMSFAGLVAALSRYSSGPRRKKRDQIPAKTMAPRTNMIRVVQDSSS